MKKRQTGKVKRFAMETMAALMSAGIISGCVRQTDTPIVLERTDRLQEKSKQAWQKAGDETEEQGEQRGAIREQADIPEIYRVDIREENITIKGNVNVETPEIDRIPFMEVQHLPYTDEELKKIKEILRQEVGITQWVEGSQSTPQTYDSPDYVYNLSLGAGRSGQTPMVWLSCPGISDGIGGDDNMEGLLDFSLAEEEKKRIQEDVEKKAEKLLERMELEGFYLEDVRWRPLFVSTNYSWTPSGHWGIRLYYKRRIEGMAVIECRSGEDLQTFPLQYVEFLYQEDGTLLAVKDIGREEVTGPSGYSGFLLPFLSVSQVFEQCMKTAEIFHQGERDHMYLSVTEVKLAYWPEYGNRPLASHGADFGEGRLVPVWAFYGTWESGNQNLEGMEIKPPQAQANGGKKTLLLAVNAEDGTIYGK